MSEETIGRQLTNAKYAPHERHKRNAMKETRGNSLRTASKHHQTTPSNDPQGEARQHPTPNSRRCGSSASIRQLKHKQTPHTYTKQRPLRQQCKQQADQEKHKQSPRTACGRLFVATCPCCCPGVRTWGTFPVDRTLQRTRTGPVVGLHTFGSDPSA